MLKILERLHEDHEKVEQLFRELEGREQAGDQRANLCRKLVLELTAHTKFEEEVFYPAVQNTGGGKSDEEVSEALQEHEEAKQLLEQLEESQSTSDKFLEILSQLKEAVQEHVRHEEDEIFPLAREGIQPGESDGMARRHDEMMREAA